MPSKLKVKMLVGFCLMSLLPILAGVYITSLFVRFPFHIDIQTLTTVSLVCLFSLLLSFLGYKVTREGVEPILDVTAAAKSIARGELDQDVKTMPESTDEIQDLTRSLRLIAQNAKELLEKVEKLSLRDRLTGLYNGVYIRERLDEEIQRSIHYQRPCAFAFLQIQNYDSFVSLRGEVGAEQVLKSVAGVLSANLRQFDRAARVGHGDFVTIFPDRNKKRAIEIMETVAQQISELMFASGSGERLSPCVGVSENPIDGVQADGLFVKAQDRMKSAKAGGKRVEAFA